MAERVRWLRVAGLGMPWKLQSARVTALGRLGHSSGLSPVALPQCRRARDPSVVVLVLVLVQGLVLQMVLSRVGSHQWTVPQRHIQLRISEAGWTATAAGLGRLSTPGRGHAHPQRQPPPRRPVLLQRAAAAPDPAAGRRPAARHWTAPRLHGLGSSSFPVLS